MKTSSMTTETATVEPGQRADPVGGPTADPDGKCAQILAAIRGQGQLDRGILPGHPSLGLPVAAGVGGGQTAQRDPHPGYRAAASRAVTTMSRTAIRVMPSPSVSNP